jgi:elongator complex protein 3
VRCREVRGREVDLGDLSLNELVYPSNGAEEHFLSFDSADDKLAGFLRLSLPGSESPDTGIPELRGAAVIREVHVYGQSLPVGSEQSGAAQHIGLGTRLLKRAEEIAHNRGYEHLAVISAIGTRRYYQHRGFEHGEFYMLKQL